MTDVQDPAIQGNEKQENDSSSEVSLKQSSSDLRLSYPSSSPSSSSTSWGLR